MYPITIFLKSLGKAWGLLARVRVDRGRREGSDSENTWVAAESPPREKAEAARSWVFGHEDCTGS